MAKKSERVWITNNFINSLLSSNACLKIVPWKFNHIIFDPHFSLDKKNIKALANFDQIIFFLIRQPKRVIFFWIVRKVTFENQHISLRISFFKMSKLRRFDKKNWRGNDVKIRKEGVFTFSTWSLYSIQIASMDKMKVFRNWRTAAW